MLQADALKVYSENCVVFLLSTWVRHGEPYGETEDSDGSEMEYAAVEANQRCTPGQLEELAHNVRVVNLSPSYLHNILPHLEWFHGCSGMKALPILMLHKASGMTELNSQWSGPPAWRLSLAAAFFQQ